MYVVNCPTKRMTRLWLFLLYMVVFVRCNWFDYHSSILLHEVSSKDFLEDLNLIPFDAATIPGEVRKFNIPFHIQAHGTTTLAFIHNDSVIICVDSKASMGNYVSSRTVKKIFPVCKTVVATMAGGAADCSHLIRAVSLEARMIEEVYSTPMRVKAMAKMLSALLRKDRGKELSVGTMLAGYDIDGPKLYYVDDQGSCIEGEMFCVGSGSHSAYSVLDSSRKSPADLTLAEAVDTALWAVKHATYRDGYSGGYITVVKVNSSGIFPIRRVDSRKMSFQADPTGQGELK